MTCVDAHAGGDGGVDGLLELVANGRWRVVVDRFAVHVPGAPAVVHQHDGGADSSATTPARSWSYCSALTSLTIAAPRAMASRATSGLVGVDRDERTAGEGLENRQHAPQLLGGVDRLGARACGLAADVEDVGAVLEHLPAGVHGPCGIEAAAAVGERVRRDVDDAHDERALAEEEGGRSPWKGDRVGAGASVQ